MLTRLRLAKRSISVWTLIALRLRFSRFVPVNGMGHNSPYCFAGVSTFARFTSSPMFLGPPES